MPRNRRPAGRVFSVWLLLATIVFLGTALGLWLAPRAAERASSRLVQTPTKLKPWRQDQSARAAPASPRAARAHPSPASVDSPGDYPSPASIDSPGDYPSPASIERSAGRIPAGASQPQTNPARPAQTRAAPAGRVAVIFDDAGQHLDQLSPVMAIGRPVAVAVLPGLRASREVSERARAAGLEVLLHLPLEADDSTRNLGPGGITMDMDQAAIRAQVLADLESVPGAVGMNGHMGSRGTADRRVMAAVIEVARDRGLFFVDSRTTPRSVAVEVAHEMGVRTGRRHVFLDNEEDPEAIARQIRELITIARVKGEAIGIGHVQRVTADVLRALLPEFDRAGVIFVPLSTLVR